MGFSISWVAFRDVSKAEVLSRLKFHAVDEVDEVPEVPFTIVEPSNGWTIIFANDFDYASAEHIAQWSANATVIGCQIEEYVMFSAAHAAVNGQAIWSVWHDGQQSPLDCKSSGTPPEQWAAILKKLLAEQNAHREEKPAVDYVFDAPPDLAQAIAGFRHDLIEFSWGTPKFRTLKQFP